MYIVLIHKCYIYVYVRVCLPTCTVQNQFESVELYLEDTEKLKFIYNFGLDIPGKFNGRRGSFSSYLKLAVSQPPDSFTFILPRGLVNCETYF